MLIKGSPKLRTKSSMIQHYSKKFFKILPKASLKRFTIYSALILLAPFSLNLVNAQPQTPELAELNLNVFPGGFNWPTYAAQDLGIFKQHGLKVNVQGTKGSVYQMTDLSQGKFDIAMTALDNIVAYVEGQGEAPIGAQPDFVAIMGSDNSFLSLVCTPDVKTIADLKGRTLSVDARTTGYAFVLFEILDRNHLGPSDYLVETAGGMTQRYNALLAKKHTGTMLSAPFNILAKQNGFNQLASAIDVLGHYQGNVAATRRSWAEKNSDKIVSFIQSYTQAIDWLYAPENHAQAVKILLANVPSLTPELAESTYAELLNPRSGFFKKGAIDSLGVKTVLNLRSKYALPHKDLDNPDKYYDLTYYNKALSNK